MKAEYREGDILLIQCLENSIFFFMLNGETGCMELPKKDDTDGIFHVTGKVTVSKDMQLDALLERLEPLLEWNQDGLKVLLCPLHDCCVDPSRNEQQRKEDGVRMLKELYQLRRALKTRLIQRKIRNVILVDPLACLRGRRGPGQGRADNGGQLPPKWGG